MKKDKKKSILTLIFAIILIVAAFFVVLVGIPTDGWDNKDKNVGTAKNIVLGLDLRGGASITYQVKGKFTAQNLEDTIAKLQDRVEAYSTEASVYKEGENRIVVDIPGVTDQNEAFKKLSEVGTIEFKTEDGKTVIDGNDITKAEAGTDTSDVGAADYVVRLTLNNAGKTKFAKATEANIGKKISIYYNNEELQSPTVNTAITNGEAVISGQGSQEKAENLATFIRIGSLPIELEAIRSTTVGAQLGEEALTSSIWAGLIGFIIVVLFMILIYRIPGLVASIALSFYVGIVLFLLNVLDITLTLPGIAGIILSVGMAVDANVIIFTRIKEEIGLGKSVKSSIEVGFNKALSAILDGNITTLIAAIVLGLKGSGTVKGFAYTLGIGIVVSMFTALTVTKKLLWAFFYLGADKPSLYGKKASTRVFDFVGNKVKYFIISGVIILAGVGAMIYSYVDSGEIFAYSLEFKGGTSMEIEFKNAKVPSNAELEKFFYDTAKLQATAAPVKDSNKVIVKTVDLSNDLATKEKIQTGLKEKYSVDVKDVQEEIISATVSNEMKSNAIVAVGLATIAMLIYIWFRFKKLSFALGSVIPLVHDVFIVLSVYALTQITVGNTFIACMLTLVGYSINATIVIFDRIRESKATIKTRDDKKKLVNECISQTLTRSINTSLTTFIMVFVLYIMGVASIREFTFPLMAGIVCGAYSSVCIAGTVWFVLDRGKEKSVSEKDKKIKESKDKILV